MQKNKKPGSINSKSAAQTCSNPAIFLSAFLPAIIAILLTGCSPARSGDRSADVLRMALRGEPVQLNPILASDMGSIFVNGFIFNGLVRYDENLEIVPDLAESWEIEDGGKRIVFHLKKGVKWHDGKEFTAKDVVFTYQKTVDPSTNTFNAGLFKVGKENIKFHALDDYTVEAELPSPFAPFFNNLTLVPVAPEHLLKDQDVNRCDYNRSPVGTGPFKFVEWKTSDRVTLEANPEYFRGNPKLKRIEFRIIPSAEGARIALMSNQVDMAGLSAEDLFVIKHLKNFPSFVEIKKWDSFTYVYFSFDLTNPLFKDLKVRRAINYAINRDALVQTALHGFGSPIHGPIPIPSWAYTDHVGHYEYNPEKAKNLLDEAGWKPGGDGIREKDGKKLSFKVIYINGSRASESACIQMQSYLSSIGVQLKLQALDKGALIDSLYPHKFESVVFNWAEPFDPDIYTEWNSTQVEEGMNFMSYSNPEVDVLLEKARESMDRETRKKLYHEIQKKIVEDAPYVWLWNQDSAMGVNQRVKGLSKPSPAGLLVDPEKVWVDG